MSTPTHDNRSLTERVDDSPAEWIAKHREDLEAIAGDDHPAERLVQRLLDAYDRGEL